MFKGHYEKKLLGACPSCPWESALICISARITHILSRRAASLSGHAKAYFKFCYIFCI